MSDVICHLPCSASRRIEIACVIAARLARCLLSGLSCQATPTESPATAIRSGLSWFAAPSRLIHWAVA
jgi:hypothetical protein